jgi:hypothetical protein
MRKDPTDPERSDSIVMVITMLGVMFASLLAGAVIVSLIYAVIKLAI